MQIEYHVEGADSLAVRVRAEGEEVRREIVDAISDAVEEAASIMRANVPVRSGELMRSIETGPVVFRPGGVGGGGFYEAELKVGEGVDHMGFVTEGTGIHGPLGRNDNYRTKDGHVFDIAPGNIMAIKKAGEPIKYRPAISGQEPQTEWIEIAQEAANAVIAQAIARI